MRIKKAFRDELEFLQKIRHPNVVQFLGAVTQSSPMMIVTEYLPKGDLCLFLKRKGALRPTTAVRFALDIASCRGMSYLHENKPEAIIHRDLEPSPCLKQLKAATNDFNSANKIGEGGFGPVYKGQLPDGTVIAVKQLSSKSRQGNREFLNEMGMISCFQHSNLVKLHGCCIDGGQLLLVYEYMENNNLARALFGEYDVNYSTV
ncbi:probable LRR receptor-like serine/threonine-protein kinase At1g29720 isoform X2 [Prunus avium]|uniref:Probable LRR receptor-like serine/threonine-protein kinase At1g29720 isoform X2 n=1 Tax=Prunus avium TaxID=42229 RepID=A0A6P5RCS2_PRUAV|nr:probable LRR receptor-like serine/threonine-protein kinase At1g29720 isoform X2 [Prunus avium]